MKNITFLLPVIMLSLATSCGRKVEITVPVKYEGVSRQLANYYNEGQFDSLFMMYSENLRNGLSKKDFGDNMGVLRRQTGEIKKITFEYSLKSAESEDSTAFFRLDFPKPRKPLSLNMTLDSTKRFTGLWFRPYMGEQ